MESGKLFRKLGSTTIVAVYLLILVGGIVRATGAGMGCPDWPKCFGMWVPPTSIEQLPVNYKELFGAKLKGEVLFNPIKTWIEYVNRLVGVFIGLLIFGTFVISVLTYHKKDILIVGLSFIAFVLVAVEGWLGSKVVSTELHPGLITLHMLLSIIIVGILLYAVMRSYKYVLVIETITKKSALNFLLVTLMVISLGQTLLGTQVREGVDTLIMQSGRNLNNDWFSEIGGIFYMHIVMSVIVLSFTALLFKNIKANALKKSYILRLTTFLLVIVLIEILSGSVMGIFKIPAFAQPIHLFFGVVIIGIQFTIFLLLNRESVNSYSKELI